MNVIYDLINVICHLQDETEHFHDEVSATVKRAILAGHTVDNVALEVNSLKFAQAPISANCSVNLGELFC